MKSIKKKITHPIVPVIISFIVLEIIVLLIVVGMLLYSI